MIKRRYFWNLFQFKWLNYFPTCYLSAYGYSNAWHQIHTQEAGYPQATFSRVSGAQTHNLSCILQKHISESLGKTKSEEIGPCLKPFLWEEQISAVMTAVTSDRKGSRSHHQPKCEASRYSVCIAGRSVLFFVACHSKEEKTHYHVLLVQMWHLPPHSGPISTNARMPSATIGYEATEICSQEICFVCCPYLLSLP